MKLLFAFAFGLVLVSSCDEFTNVNHKLWRMLEPLPLQGLSSSIQDATFPLLKSYPPLNQCLGSIDWNEILGVGKYLVWPSRNQDVSNTIDYLMTRTEFYAQIKALSSAPQDNFISFFQYLKQRPVQEYQQLCAVYENHLMPMIHTAVKPQIERLLAHSHECCTELKADFGPDLTSRIETIVQAFGHVICSIQNSTTCGQVFIQSFFHGNWVKTLWDLILVVEIPNYEACQAFVGNSFETTRGKKRKFKLPMDSCAAPIDAFVSQVFQIPFFQSFDILNQLFQPDQCLPLEDLIHLMEKYNFGKDMVGMMRNFLSGKCFHIPHAFRQDCAFQNPQAVPPF